MARLNLDNAQEVVPYGVMVARGNYAHLSSIDKFGLNPSIGTSFETVWDGGGIYAYPSEALAMTATSQDETPGNDAGVEVTIEGLDANYDIQSATVTLDENGTATTTETFLRVFRAYVSGATEPGDDIAITNTATTYAQITYPYNQTLMTLYTIPAGYKGYLVSGHVSGLKDKDITAKLLVRLQGKVFRTSGVVLTPGTPFLRKWDIPNVLPEKTDIEIQCKAGATGAVAANFEILLERL